MPSSLILALLLIAGGVLGIIFFGGLWLTVRALPTARYPTLLAVVSFWGRTALVVAAFTYAFTRGWRSILACLLGFVTARFILARCIPQRPGAGVE